jgi:type IV pilus assembly protein PilC
MHPKIFNKLYINMVKAGELSGALEITLRRLADFMEKAQKIKGKVKAAMFYPVSVLVVSMGILTLLMLCIVPRFRVVFDGLGAKMPPFTVFVFNLSSAVQHHFVMAAIGFVAFWVGLLFAIRTTNGRRLFDHFKLHAPVLGPVFRKLAISRFARTLGTLLGNGVPILQALNIVKETTGNVIVSRVISTVHDSVKEGETIAVPLKASGVFPAMVAGMVDIGEQTGALPDMLMKVADNYDDQVDNAVTSMTSLLEPIMIVFLAVVVGGIVIALFLPILSIINDPAVTGDGARE